MTNIVELWRRRKSGSRSNQDTDNQFETLLRPHIAALYRLVWRWCNNPDEAEEILQTVVCKLYPRHQELAGIDQLRPWLARIVYREFIDHYRRSKKQPGSLDTMSEQDLHDSQPDPADLPDKLLESELIQKQLNQALQVLPEAQRVLVIMHDVEGYTLEEISTALDTPVGTLKSRLHRSREKLRHLLNPDGTLLDPQTCNEAED